LDFSFPESLVLFADARNLKLIRKVAKGWSSEIFLAKDCGGRKVVLKVLREKSNRREMVQRESANLSLANSVGVGPKLYFFDIVAGVVGMEFIDGVPFGKWIFSGVSRNELERFIGELYLQAKKLDLIGLDHGQLAGSGRNILVRDGLPVIIDFEKASTSRKVHNVNVVDSFLFRSRGSKVVEKVFSILGLEKEK
jgi:putative serine/threonine protein kinase